MVALGDRADRQEASRPRILVVDDEPENRALLTRILSDAYSVEVAGSGREALTMLERDQFAVIIADQRMPEMTGVQFLAQVLHRAPDSVRIMLTAYSDEQTIVEAINVAAISGFLRKPVTAQEVHAAIYFALEVRALTIRHSEIVQRFIERTFELERTSQNPEQIITEREDATRRIAELGARDPLTGLYNERYLYAQIAEQIDRAQRHQDPGCLILFDVDGFHLYNEAHGKQRGDGALIQLARIVDGTTPAALRLRRTEVVARYGAEKFAVLAPHTNLEGGRILAQRMRATVAAMPFEGAAQSQPGGHLTVSVGVAEFPRHGVDARSLMQAAEAAVQRSKAAGRDRVELAS